MQKDMIKTCEQCGEKFSCNTDEIAECWCMKFYAPRIGDENYKDCVCPKCLEKQKKL